MKKTEASVPLFDFDVEDANWELMASHRDALGVRTRNVPCLTFTLREGRFFVARLNVKAEELILKVADQFYPYIDVKQGIIGLSASDVGPVLIRNKGIAGIKKLTKQFNPDINVRHMLVVQTDKEYKRLHDIDFLLIPFSEQSRKALDNHGFDYVRRKILGLTGTGLNND